MPRQYDGFCPDGGYVHITLYRPLLGGYEKRVSRALRAKDSVANWREISTILCADPVAFDFL